jgi:hypothetical protein
MTGSIIKNQRGDAMRNIQQNNDQESTLNRKWSVSRVGPVAMPKTLSNYILRMVSPAVAVLVLLVLFSSESVIHTAMAAPLLNFSLVGPQTIGPQMAQTGIPLTGINVHLVNTGTTARQDARLRILIHQDEAVHRDLQADDIQVDVLEGTSWLPVPLKPIDDGVMGAIGAEGSGHKELHHRGGFAIPAKLNRVWQLRITFRLPGLYKMVTTVSPDNGNTHLAQPSSITLETL